MQGKEKLYHIELLNNKAKELAAFGDVKGAINLFRSALEIDPGHFESNYNTGNLYYQQEDVLKAIRFYLYALNTRFDNRSAVINLCCGLIELGYEQTMQSLLEAYLEDDPNKVREVILFLDKELGDENQKSITEKPDFDDRITILIPTTFCTTAPETVMIEHVINTFQEMTGLCNCSFIVHYDMKDRSKESQQYLNNLLNLSMKYDHMRIIHSIRGGLGTAMIRMCDLLKTDYYFLLEHDWQFVRNIDLKAVMSMMDKHDKKIHYIRFNKRNNKAMKFDHTLQPSYRFGVRMLKTSAWSNNPHIGRTDKLKKDWLSLLRKDTGSASGVEDRLYARYQQDIVELGFEKAQEQWGVFLYGQLDEERYVAHLASRISGVV